MYRCFYIILRGSLIIYAEVTKLIKWKHLYKWLLLIINGLKLCKTLYVTPKHSDIKVKENNKQSKNTKLAEIKYRLNQKIKFFM